MISLLVFEKSWSLTMWEIMIFFTNIWEIMGTVKQVLSVISICGLQPESAEVHYIIPFNVYILDGLRTLLPVQFVAVKPQELDLQNNTHYFWRIYCKFSILLPLVLFFFLL